VSHIVYLIKMAVTRVAEVSIVYSTYTVGAA